MELPTGLSVVPGPAGGEGCSLEGGCASCPYMKMNSLSALMMGESAWRQRINSIEPCLARPGGSQHQKNVYQQPAANQICPPPPPPWQCASAWAALQARHC